MEPLRPGWTRLADGRRLAWAEYGDPEGAPVFYFHGFPGSRLEVQLVAPRLVGSGVRLIAPDRPGFGDSDPRPGRRITDWPSDVAAMADALGLERFACLGASGGGPYALACARELAPRLRGVAVACGLGPWDEPASRRGMLASGRSVLALARGPRWLLRAFLALPSRRLRRDPEATLSRVVAKLPPADREVLAEEGRLSLLARSTLEAFRQGTTAAAQEAALFVRPWGFAPEAVSLEVQLFQGERDVNVPPATARRLRERLPHCRARFYPDEAHLSLVLRRTDEILASLF